VTERNITTRYDQSMITVITGRRELWNEPPVLFEQGDVD
jgi:hypothetical protein